MIWKDIEKAFNRAFWLSFSRKKILLTFAGLVLCGIIVVFCRALAYEASGYLAMSLVFLPFFLSSAILLALGTLLIRLHFYEINREKIHYHKLLSSSWDTALEASSLCVPTILAYIVLWIVLGVFTLLQDIPFIGPVMEVVLSFTPFLLILASLLLVVFNLVLLFFMTPPIALKNEKRLYIVTEAFHKIKSNIFTNSLFLVVSLFPLLLVVGLLSLAAILTGFHCLVARHLLCISLEWFFIMIPFCALLAPAIVFFFNFASEAYNLGLQRKNYE